MVSWNSYRVMAAPYTYFKSYAGGSSGLVASLFAGMPKASFCDLGLVNSLLSLTRSAQRRATTGLGPSARITTVGSTAHLRVQHLMVIYLPHPMTIRECPPGFLASVLFVLHESPLAFLIIRYVLIYSGETRGYCCIGLFGCLENGGVQRVLCVCPGTLRTRFPSVLERFVGCEGILWRVIYGLGRPPRL